MKKILSAIIFLITTLFLIGCSSPFKFLEKPATDKEMEHKYLLEYNDDTTNTQTSLFEKSIIWVAKGWKDTYSVIDYNDLPPIFSTHRRA